MVTEKNNLIEKFGTEKKDDAARIATLTGQLDAWEGRANPWKLWPPSKENPPRREVLVGLQKQLDASLVPQLSGAKLSAEDEVRGLMSLAMVADAANKPEEAARYYESAKVQLAALRQQDPRNLPIGRALAKCSFELARLTVDSDRAEATKLVEASRSLRQEIAALPRADASDQVAWLESELYCAELVGNEPESLKHLTRAARINGQLESLWPKSPAEVYRLACSLTNSDPILADSTTP